jgi:hypothetical protein
MRLRISTNKELPVMRWIVLSAGVALFAAGCSEGSAQKQTPAAEFHRAQHKPPKH